MFNFLKSNRQKVYKFVLVGLISTFINYSFFTILFKLFEFYYIFASASGYLIGLLFGFQLNKNWTFITQVNKNQSYVTSYFLVYLISLLSSQILLFFLVEVLILSPLIGNIMAIGLSTSMNFLGTNFLVFKVTKAFN